MPPLPPPSSSPATPPSSPITLPPSRSAAAPPQPHRPAFSAGGTPFCSAEEAWFWFIQAQEAKASGARVVAGLGLVQRPCEPLDIYRAIDRLYRQRKLMRDHLHVLVHYGRRLMPPDPARDREYRAAQLWGEAFRHIVPALRDKGIVAAGNGADTGPARGGTLQ